MNVTTRSAEATPVPKRALVTGGSGLLGGNIVRRLLAEGTEVIALVRDGDRAGRLLPTVANLRIAQGDITDVASYRRQLTDVDAIFHTAATFREYFQPRVDTARLMRTNVDAVEDLLHAAAEAGVPVVVHTSSTTTLRRATNGTPGDEETPPPPDFEENPYRASKVRSEEVVRRFVERYDAVRVPIILPGWMWGPGDPGEPGSSGRLFLGIARGELRALPRGVRHVVDARDVADAFIRAAAVGESGRRYIVGGRRYPLSEVFGTVADAVDMPRPRELPLPVAMAAVGLLEMASALRGRSPAATRTGVRLITEVERITSDRAERELGVSFRPLAETMTDETRWFEQQGLLGQRADIGLARGGGQPAEAPR